MGNMCGGGGMTPDEVSAKQASKKIDKELEKSKSEAQKEVKLLLLGTAYPQSRENEKEMDSAYPHHVMHSLCCRTRRGG
jgi:hypothetical protein